MSRPLRIEFPGALYHLTARGNARADIFVDDADRRNFLSVLERTVERCGWLCHAYCLMSNHYHLLVETPQANLSRGMRHLNGVYSQRFNRAHGRVGHVFQGRYKAILVEKEAHLLELVRYVVLNPVRAGLARRAGDWPWSSFLATAGEAVSPGWLTTGWILGQFARRRKAAMKNYAGFVAEGKMAAGPWDGLRHQVFLGGENFVREFHDGLAEDGTLAEIPLAQRRPAARPLAEYQAGGIHPRQAMARAYASGAYSLAAIARHFGVHYSTVSRAVNRAEGGG
ncbi:MAG: transposase [Proteobacteria bacterium]|nr:transposase [Pseudomonadota bacterium]